MVRWKDREAEAVLDRLGAGWSGAEVAVVLGSGLGEAARAVEVRAEAGYEDLPSLGACTAAGHAGRLLRGALWGAEVVVFRGRRHLYEGVPMAQAALPARLAAVLGASLLITVSAVGAADEGIPVGCWVLVEDHLNFMGRNPLEGVATTSGPAFVDLSRTYRADLHGCLGQRLMGRGLVARGGVLAAFPGPSYETPAEVRMARTLGASIVGMSTVPEAVWARFLGLDVLAAARVANMAAGLTGEPLSHSGVLLEMERGAGEAEVVLQEAIEVWTAGRPAPRGRAERQSGAVGRKQRE